MTFSFQKAFVLMLNLNYHWLTIHVAKVFNIYLRLFHSYTIAVLKKSITEKENNHEGSLTLDCMVYHSNFSNYSGR